MMPRQNWTDERLDQFEKRVDERFDHFEKEVGLRFNRIEADVKEMRGDIKHMQRTMTLGVIAICTVMTGGFVSILVAFIGENGP